jgi:cell division protein FtsL
VDTLLERLSPGQIVAVISILVGCIVALAMIVAITKYQFQLLADDTALKREKQQVELSLKQKMIERGAAGASSLDHLLATDMIPAPAVEVDAELAKLFGYLSADAETIEMTLRQALATAPERKRMIRDVVDELMGNEASPEAILAAVRPLCAPVRVAKESACPTA